MYQHQHKRLVLRIGIKVQPLFGLFYRGMHGSVAGGWLCCASWQIWHAGNSDNTDVNTLSGHKRGLNVAICKRWQLLWVNLSCSKLDIPILVRHHYKKTQCNLQNYDAIFNALCTLWFGSFIFCQRFNAILIHFLFIFILYIYFESGQERSRKFKCKKSQNPY